MNQIEHDYRIAAGAYQANRPNYIQAARHRRMQMISDVDYFRMRNMHVDLEQALEHAEAIWIASWR